MLALKGCKLNLPFYISQSLKKMLHLVQSFDNPNRSLFHHGLVKIIIRHQLSLNGKSWDEFLIECQFGPTQFWPNPSPKTRRKRKATVKPGVSNVPEAESKDK